MAWFRKKKAQPSVVTRIGDFTFVDNCWRTHLESSPILIVTAVRLDLEIIDSAQALLKEIEQRKAEAIEFARRTSPESLRPLSGTNDLPVLEEIDLTNVLSNGFGLTFGVASDPGYTMTVEFERGKPVVVWAAD